MIFPAVGEPLLQRPNRDPLKKACARVARPGPATQDREAVPRRLAARSEHLRRADVNLEQSPKEPVRPCTDRGSSAAMQARGDSALKRRRRGRLAKFSNPFGLAFDFLVHLGLMIVIPRKSGVNLGKRKMRMIFVNRLRAPTVGDMIENNFNNLNIGIVHPRSPLRIDLDVRDNCRCRHTWKVSKRTPSDKAGSAIFGSEQG